MLQMHGPLEGPGLGQLPSIGLLWAICGFGWVQSQGDKGCGGPISPSQCSFRIWCSRGGFNIGKMVPICRLPWSEAYQVAPSDRGQWLSLACSGAPPKGATEKGTMTAVPLVFTPAPHNSVFPECLLYLPSCQPSAGTQGACLQANESMGRLFKGNVWVSGFLSCCLDSQHPY